MWEATCELLISDVSQLRSCTKHREGVQKKLLPGACSKACAKTTLRPSVARELMDEIEKSSFNQAKAKLMGSLLPIDLKAP